MKSAAQVLVALRAPLADLPDLEVEGLDFGLPHHGPNPISARLASWANAGASNCRRAGDVLFSWDANPRVQQNGSVLGRVYAQPRGELTRDVGGFKIDRDGNVVSIPDEFRAALGEAS